MIFIIIIESSLFALASIFLTLNNIVYTTLTDISKFNNTYQFFFINFNTLADNIAKSY